MKCHDFVDVPNDRCHCLPTINKLLSTSPLASIYSFESKQPLQIIPVHLLLPKKKHHIPKVAPPLQMRGEILPLQNRLLAFWADEVPHEVLPPQRGGEQKNECDFSWVMKKDGFAEMGESWSGKYMGCSTNQYQNDGPFWGLGFSRNIAEWKQFREATIDKLETTGLHGGRVLHYAGICTLLQRHM